MLAGACSYSLKSQEMPKEYQEVVDLGVPHISTTTTINMPGEIAKPDHVIWSMFNILFMNFCCLGFIAYVYSVKVLYVNFKLDLLQWYLRCVCGDLVSVCESLYASSCVCARTSMLGNIQSRDRKMVGDMTGAQAYASTAKCLNICALVFSILMVIVIIIVYASGHNLAAF
ncbi:hypothetical protein A6R68_00584 [Neotoma lepida]|uniref:Interferon-induced transmembrane protein 3 n=1 Tax=Neotoma lepida TaxID=56216 RepID=A0A1A6GZ94_NEOLE|nr:hypothetical protein A6R68_00584 [Neotoma lepida]